MKYFLLNLIYFHSYVYRGYSCGDHFYESDTIQHSWEVLVQILVNKSCHGIVIDVGMPVRHKNVVYNCRVVALNGKILLIRPKLILCDDGNYRETRWFAAWSKVRSVEEHTLMPRVQQVNFIFHTSC